MSRFNTRGFLRLVLFDIDGTLISTNGIAKHTFAETLDRMLGMQTIARTHDFAGKTDPQIYREVMIGSGLAEADVAARQDEALTAFLDLLEQRLTERDITVKPGVPALLDALEQETVVTMGLLTGNMIRGARLKLAPVKLDRYFPFGAFGSDAPDRHQLPSIAVERAYHRTGYVFRDKEIVIVGDTPNDIACGRHLNVRTIAVATGGATADTLRAHEPDFLFDDLGDTAAVLDAILS